MNIFKKNVSEKINISKGVPKRIAKAKANEKIKRVNMKSKTMKKAFQEIVAWALRNSNRK